MLVILIWKWLRLLLSKIAHGVPLGADMDYIDTLTLEMALEDRKKLSNKDENNF